MQRRTFITHHSRRQARRIAGAIACTAMTIVVVGTLGMCLLTEMAIHVAHGGKLHIGADILFADFSVSQLLTGATLLGGAAVLAGIVALFAAIKAED